MGSVACRVLENFQSSCSPAQVLCSLLTPFCSSVTCRGPTLGSFALAQPWQEAAGTLQAADAELHLPLGGLAGLGSLMCWGQMALEGQGPCTPMHHHHCLPLKYHLQQFLARFCTKPSSCMPPCTCQQGAWPLTLRSQLETKSSKLPLSRNC